MIVAIKTRIVAGIGSIVLNWRMSQIKWDSVKSIDEKIGRTMAPGRSKEQIKVILESWMTRLQYLDFLL
jgi:hypothetical protein